MAESKKKPQKTDPRAEPTHRSGVSERQRAHTKTRSGQSWINLSNNIVKVVLAYNPKCKINTDESILL